MAYISGKMAYHPWDRNGQRPIPATPQARRGYEKPWMTNMKGLTPRQRAAIEVSSRLYGRRVSQSDGFTLPNIRPTLQPRMYGMDSLIYNKYVNMKTKMDHSGKEQLPALPNVESCRGSQNELKVGVASIQKEPDKYEKKQNVDNKKTSTSTQSMQSMKFKNSSSTYSFQSKKCPRNNDRDRKQRERFFLHIEPADGYTDRIRGPRIMAKLSQEAQYAMLKGYEDTVLQYLGIGKDLSRATSSSVDSDQPSLIKAPVFPCLESLKSDESEETGQASDPEVISNETKATSLNMRRASFQKFPLIYNHANPIVGFRRPSQTPIYLKGSIPKLPRLVESENQELTQKFECAMDILDRIKQTRDLDSDSQKH